MQVRSSIIASLAFAATSFASSYDGGNLPDSHVLWGVDGPQSKAVDKRATISTQTPTSTRVADSACTNGPLTRNCWSNGYSVATDFDRRWPTTGVTKSVRTRAKFADESLTVIYELTLTNTTCDPDGNGARICLLFNNQYPGPLITADWGDYISVTVTNKMQNNGTSVHWHGSRQFGSNSMDGVNGLTECPIAPGETRIYSFQATQFGTSWYHSHYSNQYGDGAVGTMIVHGPASANYDIDLGVLPVTDWYYDTAYQVGIQTNIDLQQRMGGPPGDNILINGTNKNSAGAGQYFQATLTPGKKHRVRIVNTSVDNAIRVSVDHHQMQVITADLVPIEPIYTDSVLVAIGQRYDVVINANQTVANYWIRATVEYACYTANHGAGLAIFHYAGATSGDPTTRSTALDNGCNPPGMLTPWVPNNVGSEAAFKQQATALEVNIELPGTTSNNQNVVVWGINMTAIQAQWDNPTLSYVMTGNTSYPVTANLIEIPNEGIWTYWIIQEVEGGPASIPHPIHLHGHDFYIMGTGYGTFNISSDPDNLSYENPTRRDTTFLPAGGWLVIAFQADNPGAWLMHCHIAWHISEGLGVQFLEAKNKIKLPGASYTDQCNAWKSYYANAIYKQDDSGL